MISILIPVYNREKHIEATVSSAIAQTYEDIEVIVVDNKSTDKTWEILERLSLQDKRIRIFQNEKNIGPVRNWKRCIDEAQGEFGKILWSDDLIAPDFLEKTLPCLKNHSDVGFVFTKTEIFDDELKTKREAYSIGPSGKYKTKFFIDNTITHSSLLPLSPGCALFRMDDLRSNLLVDIPNKLGIDFPNIAIGNDLLIYLLTAHRYSNFAYIDETLSFFRSHSDSISLFSDKGRFFLLYDMAKAHFLEYYYCDKAMIRIFNTILFIHLRKFRNNPDGLKKIVDFYSLNNIHSISYYFLIKIILNNILTRFAMGEK